MIEELSALDLGLILSPSTSLITSMTRLSPTSTTSTSTTPTSTTPTSTTLLSPTRLSTTTLSPTSTSITTATSTSRLPTTAPTIRTPLTTALTPLLRAPLLRTPLLRAPAGEPVEAARDQSAFETAAPTFIISASGGATPAPVQAAAAEGLPLFDKLNIGVIVAGGLLALLLLRR